MIGTVLFAFVFQLPIIIYIIKVYNIQYSVRYSEPYTSEFLDYLEYIIHAISVVSHEHVSYENRHNYPSAKAKWYMQQVKIWTMEKLILKVGVC